MSSPVRALLAGEDGPGRAALPIGEFLAPAPLVALALLIVNDRLLKGHAPGWLTGKLSDFAGMLFFPLLCTAACDLVLFGVARARVDFSLNRRKLAAAVAATGVLFSAIKLSPAAAQLFDHVLRALHRGSRTTPDPTDLMALVMLPVAYLLGVREIRRVPLGRLEVIARRKSVGDGLADVAGSAALAAALDAWLAQPGEDTRARAQAALDDLRP